MNLMKQGKRVMFLLNSIKPIFFFTARCYDAAPSLQVHNLTDYGLSNVGEMAVLMPLLGN